jgi:uncharacterized DUF497 family protein
MKLAADAILAAWLEHFSGRPEDFDWDVGNRTKHRKHGVEPGDVEALFRRRTVFLGRVVEPMHEELRGLLLGQDAAGRRLTLIFTRRGSRLRPVSCRAMRRDERKVYEEAIAQED